MPLKVTRKEGPVLLPLTCMKETRMCLHKSRNKTTINDSEKHDMKLEISSYTGKVSNSNVTVAYITQPVEHPNAR